MPGPEVEEEDVGGRVDDAVAQAECQGHHLHGEVDEGVVHLHQEERGGVGEGGGGEPGEEEGGGEDEVPGCPGEPVKEEAGGQGAQEAAHGAQGEGGGDGGSVGGDKVPQVEEGGAADGVGEADGKEGEPEEEGAPQGRPGVGGSIHAWAGWGQVRPGEEGRMGEGGRVV